MSVIREIAARQAGGKPKRHSLGAKAAHVQMGGGGTAETALTALRNHTHPAATPTAAGFAAAADIAKLSGIDGGANRYEHPTGSGFRHVPAGGAAGQILGWGSDGTAVWRNEDKADYAIVSREEAGLVPPPGGTGATRFLREDGAFAVPPDKDTTYAVFTRSVPGLAPAPGGSGAARFLREDGVFAVPPDKNTAYEEATAARRGLLSAGDKAKLDGIAANANRYAHPAFHPASMAVLVGGKSVEQAFADAGLLLPRVTLHWWDLSYDRIPGFTLQFTDQFFRDNDDGTVSVLARMRTNKSLNQYEGEEKYLAVGSLPFTPGHTVTGSPLDGWSSTYTGGGAEIYPVIEAGTNRLALHVMQGGTPVKLPVSFISGSTQWTHLELTFPLGGGSV